MVDTLPTQFNEATNRTIELIDVLWLKGNAIVTAFEVECTTSIYSGLLRMCDLLALQPNLEIPLYLVAPDEREAKVEQEMLRPTFNLAYGDRPLVKRCGFIPFSRLSEKLDAIHKFKLANALKPVFLNEMATFFGDEQGGKKPPMPPPEELATPQKKREKPIRSDKASAEYTESYHTDGRPNEVIELYRGLDRICLALAPGQVIKLFTAKTVNWTIDKAIFCCAHLQQGGLRVWVKTDPKEIDRSVSFARDVSKIGHWGVGNVELAVNSLDRLQDAEAFVRKSFEKETRK